MNNFLILFLFISNFSFGQVDSLKCRTLYNEKNFEESYTCYSELPTTKMDYYMCGMLAKHLEKTDEYNFWLKTLIKSFKKDDIAYQYAATLVGEESDDYQKYLKKGLKINKKNETLIVMQANYFITKSENEKALVFANKLIEINPKKVDYLVCRGAIYQHLEMEDEAIINFSAILEIAPKNFTANYGIGSIYFNRAADLNELANNTSDTEEYKKYTKAATEQMREALPFLQRAYLINRKDEPVINALKTCYLRLEMRERYQQLMDNP